MRRAVVGARWEAQSGSAAAADPAVRMRPAVVQDPRGRPVGRGGARSGACYGHRGEPRPGLEASGRPRDRPPWARRHVLDRFATC